MSCNCWCHEAALAKYATTSAYHACPACASNVFHQKPVKVTANNIWKVVRRVTRHKADHLINAHRFDLEFHADPTKGPNWALPTFSVMVSSELLENGNVSIRELLAMEINKYFKVGTTTSTLPVHLHGFLNTPDDLLPLSQNIEWKQDNDDYFASSASQQAVHGQTVTRDLSSYIPGVNAVVECPCVQPPRHDGQIIGLVQHLNDSCGWTREQVADWLESLDVDLTFPSEPPPPKQLPFAKRDERLIVLGTTLAAVDHEIRRRRRAPRDVVGVSAHQGHRVISERLRGMRDFQYVVLPGTWVHEEVQALLEHMGAREVGEDEPDPVDPHFSMTAELVKDIYASKIKAMAELYTFEGLPKSWHSKPIEIKFTKPTPPQPYHLEVSTNAPKVYVDQLAVYDEIQKWVAKVWAKTPGGPWTVQTAEYWKEPDLDNLEGTAKKLFENLKALEGSEHVDSVLWLADPKILGEHLPAVKEEPKHGQQGGHAMLFGTDSSWTKFTKPNWKKEH